MNTAVVLLMNRKGSYGDLILQLPFLFSLRKAGAERIVVLYPHEFAKIICSMKLVDELFIVSDKNSKEILKIIKAEKPKWVITLRGTSMRSTLLVSTLWGPTTIGWSSFLNYLLLHKTASQKRDTYWPFILSRILKTIGGEIDLPGFVNHIVNQKTLSESTLAEPRFVIMPNGSIDTKQWGVPNFLSLGEKLKAKQPNAKLVVILGPREEPLKLDFEKNGWQVYLKPSPVDLMALCSKALCIIANDSGPSHIGQISGAPIVLLYPQVEPKGDHTTENIFKAYFWVRSQSYAICPKSFRPISDIPVSFVLEHVEKAMNLNFKQQNQIIYWD